MEFLTLHTVWVSTKPSERTLWLVIKLKKRETAGKAEKQGDRERQCDKQGELGLEREGQVDIPEYWLLPSRTYTDGQTDLIAGVERYRDR